jgi:methylenetetrahydrofolate/methylenetetrahydromethanopterin dehydrogenase (NADP+)
MKRLLLLLDSDPMPNSYDIIVGYDGGADHIVSYGGITPDNVGALIDGAVFTRGPRRRQHGNWRGATRGSNKTFFWKFFTCR